MRSNGNFFLEYNATDNMEQSQSNIYKHRQTSFRTRKTEQRKLPLLPSRELVRKTRWREGGFQCRERCCWSSSSKIEKNVSLDHTRNCISTSNKNKKIYPRINSTVKVIPACIFIMWSVLEGTQRVQWTCTIKTSRTSSTVHHGRQT